MSKTSNFLPKFRWQTASCIAATSIGLIYISQLSYSNPQWWSTPEVTGGDTPINTDAKVDNFAPGNLGQLKNMVKHAAEHFSANGVEVPQVSQDMLTTWDESDVSNYTAVNIGQVKHASEPFWDRLIKIGQAEESDIPWTADKSDDANYGLANIGQIKNAFSFSAVRPDELDTDGDGLNNAFEVAHGLNPNNRDENGNGIIDGLDDFDGDGISNSDEQLAGTNPSDPSDGPGEGGPGGGGPNDGDVGILNPSFAINSGADPIKTFTIASLYNAADIEGWDAVTSEEANTLEIATIDGHNFVDLLGDRVSADQPVSSGVKQTFKLLPGTKKTHILWAKRREEGRNIVNDFNVTVSGGTLKIDGEEVASKLLSAEESADNFFVIEIEADSAAEDSTELVDVEIIFEPVTSN